jgi:hypothetical protein
VRSSRLGLIATLITGALGLPLAQADEYTTPNTGVCWDIDDLVANSGGVVTGSGPDYTFRGSVTISPLDTLMIAAGNTLIFDDAQSVFRLWAKGILFAQGTAGQMITFTSTHQTPGAWHSINLHQGVLEYCRVEYATHGIYVGYIESSASVAHSTIMYNQEGIFLGGPGAYAVIRENLIANNQNTGIGGDGGINKGQEGGKQWESLVEDNQILDNGYVGIGLFWGIYATIKGNLISGHDCGIVSGPYAGSIVVENTIVENNRGVLCDSDGFPGGLKLGDLGNQSFEDDGGNHIYNNLEYDLYNADPETIKAEGNHWGTTDLDIINSHIYDDEEDVGDADGNGVISGLVDFIPLGETSIQRNTWGQIKATFR